MTVKRVVVIEFEDREDVPGDSYLRYAVDVGLSQYGHEAKSITVIAKDHLLWFAEQNVFVQLRGED